jgi:hypothetical protein
MPRPTIYLMGPRHEHLLCGPTCYRMVVLTSWDRAYRDSAAQTFPRSCNLKPET